MSTGTGTILFKKATVAFPHHTFQPGETKGEVRLVDVDAYLEDRCSPKRVVRGLKERSIQKILLIHGTFAGDDVTGLLRQVGRISSRSSHYFRGLAKRGFDSLTRQTGNFPPTYVDNLNEFLLDGHDTTSTLPITSEAFAWSGENHHLGRMLGALSLAKTLTDLKQSLRDDERILILAHSHGGNLVAMLTLLLASDPDIADAIVTQTQGLQKYTKRGGTEKYLGLRELLTNRSALPSFDVMTLGTPLRYRWGHNVARKLIHLINHQNNKDGKPTDTSRVDDHTNPLKQIGSGDLIQQLGIGGSDFPPSIFTFTDWKQERGLAQLFESTVRRRDYFKKLIQGRRESADGTTLLMDYARVDPMESQKLFGHGIYTSQKLMPIQLAIAESELNA